MILTKLTKILILCFIFVSYFTAIDGVETSGGVVHAEESEDSEEGKEIGT